MITGKVFGSRGQILFERLYPFDVDLLDVSKRLEYYVQAEGLSWEDGPCAVGVSFIPFRRSA